MKSYFFIPANRQKFLSKVNDIDANQFILDLEDAVHEDEIETAVQNIIDSGIHKKVWIRIPVKEAYTDYYHSLIALGYSNYVIPKIQQKAELNTLLQDFKSKASLDFNFIVLIENPAAVENLSEILSIPEVKGLCLGSHDYCVSINMKHTLDNLYWVRMELLNKGKAFKKEVIDIASMELSNEEHFNLECIDAFEKGFDGKMIIHPWQLAIFNQAEFYTQKDLELALEIKNHMLNIGGVEKFSIYRNEHTIVEKPHLDRIKRVLEFYQHESF